MLCLWFTVLTQRLVLRHACSVSLQHASVGSKAPSRLLETRRALEVPAVRLDAEQDDHGAVQTRHHGCTVSNRSL